MKKSFFLTAVLVVLSMAVYAQNPKREFRAVWLTTHYSIDWPKTKATNAGSIKKQQTELTNIMDKLVSSNMNAFTFQVRPVADAFYKSSYEPWSGQLTGTRGQDPGYDPLAFAIEEAHKRGLELHAWVNPYRYEVNAGDWGDDDPLRKAHPEWLLTYDNGSFKGTILDPSLPEARAYTVKVIQEIIEKYDVDGVVFDDYFYPYGGTTTEDAASAAKYKPAGQDIKDWRRENVDKLIKDVYDMLQAKKPWVRFGVAPFGIWGVGSAAKEFAQKNYGIELPSGISGTNAYDLLYCNTLEWMQEGTVDYVAPQIYWSTTSKGQDYDVLSQWWSMLASHFSSRLSGGKKVHFISANAPYKIGTDGGFSPKEMGLQVNANRRYDQLGGTGAIYYNTTDFFGNDVHSFLVKDQYSTLSLVPAMSWKEATTLAAPTDLAIEGGFLTWKHNDAPRYTVYAYPKGSNLAQALADPINLLGITYSKEWDVSGVTDAANMTFAVCAYDRYGNEYEAGLLNVGEGSGNDGEEEEEPVVLNGELAVEQVWVHSVGASDWSLSVENGNRSVAYHDGKLYLPNRDSSNGEVLVINAADGKQAGTIVTDKKGFYLHNIRMTDDGQLLMGNTGSGRSNVFIYTSSVTDGGYEEVGRAALDGRSDFFYPYGNWNRRGFLLALSNTGHLLKMPFSQGTMLTEYPCENSALPQGNAAKAIPASDGTTFYASVSKTLPTRHDISTGDLLESFGSEKPVVTDVSGLAVLNLAGHDYMVTPADNNGSFEVFDISHGLGAATRALEATPTLGGQANETFTVDFAVNVVDSCLAYVYVLAPNNGLAAYKLTFIIDGSAVEDVETADVRLVSTSEGVRVQFAGTQPVEIYHVNGMLMHQAVATDSYSCALPEGMYVVRVGNTVQKFVR